AGHDARKGMGLGNGGAPVIGSGPVDVQVRGAEYGGCRMDLCLGRPRFRAQSLPTCVCVRSAALPLVVFFVSFLSPIGAAAAERIKSAPPIGDSGGGTLTTTPAIAGTIVRSANATTVWYLYPGACTDRANGTCIPRTA